MKTALTDYANRLLMETKQAGETTYLPPEIADLLDNYAYTIFKNPDATSIAHAGNDMFLDDVESTLRSFSQQLRLNAVQIF